MWPVESSPLGRVVVAPDAPLFYTTLDFPGRLTPDIARTVTNFIQQRFGIEATLATCNQVHGVAVTRVSSASGWRECDACDGLWSEERGVALAIKVADCLPVSFVDENVIANVHSGWRGAAAGIVAKTIDAVPLTSQARAYLGPSIRVCCFEVGEEVAPHFPEAVVDRSHAKPHVDLPAFTKGILRERGFTDDRIFDAGLCTRCDGSMFHSYRREKSGGRNLAIAFR
jgi:YfiH family protein